MTFERFADVWCAFLVGQKTGAAESELFRENRGCQRMIRTNGTEGSHTFRATFDSALKNVLEFADFVAAVHRVRQVVVLYGNRVSSRRRFYFVTRNRRRQSGKRGLSQFFREPGIRAAEVVGHDTTD